MIIQSKINDSEYYDSEEYDAESDPNRNPKVATYTTNRNSPHKSILNRLISNIIPGTILQIDQKITEDVAVIGETLDKRQTVLSKEIVVDAASSGACIFRTPREVSRTGRDGTTPRYGSTIVAAAMLTYPVQNFHSTTDSLSQNRKQDIINPIGPVSPQ